MTAQYAKTRILAVRQSSWMYTTTASGHCTFHGSRPAEEKQPEQALVRSTVLMDIACILPWYGQLSNPFFQRSRGSAVEADAEDPAPKFFLSRLPCEIVFWVVLRSASKLML